MSAAGASPAGAKIMFVLFTCWCSKLNPGFGLRACPPAEEEDGGFELVIVVSSSS